MILKENTIHVRQRNYANLNVFAESSIENEISEYFAFMKEGVQHSKRFKEKKWDGKTRLYSIKTKMLPSGLYDYLLHFAKKHGYDVEVENDPRYGRPDTTTGVSEQEMAQFMLGLNLTSKGKEIVPHDYQWNAFKQFVTNDKALILSATGSGKSLIMYMILRWIMANTDKKILILAPRIGLVNQLFFDFEDYSAFDDSFDVHTACHRIMAGIPKHNEKSQVYISTWQSLQDLKGGWFEQFGGIMVDEVHEAEGDTIKKIVMNCREAKYRFGTTGTLKKIKLHKLIIQGMFDTEFRVSKTKELIDRGILSPLTIHIPILNYDKKKIRRVTMSRDYHEEIDFLIGNDKRNKFIIDLAIEQEGNTLVLFNYVEKHGKPLFQKISDSVHERRKVFFVSGEVPGEDREEIRRIVETQKNAIIVASFKTFSTGINIKNLHNIIFGSPSKSIVLILQSIGRGLRKADNDQACKVFDIIDDMHVGSRKNFAFKHAEERMQIYADEEFDTKLYSIPFDPF
jgi:superfamily II DNA or RNA helicase